MLRRAVQIAALAGFVALLGGAVLTAADATLFKWMLGVDPALVLPTALAGRILVAAFIPAAVLLALAPVLGRTFCGWLCPLGTTLDGLDRLAARRRGLGRGTEAAARWRNLKYAVLGLVVGAAALGVSLVHIGSPLALATRLYGLVLYPMLVRLTDGTLGLARPAAEALDWHVLAFATVEAPAFDTTLFLLVVLGGFMAAAFAAPRLWCRTLCPAGALLALFSRRPAMRRRVADGCGGCAVCADVCPMGAIDPENSRITRHEECILCRSCQTACPDGAVTFFPVAGGGAAAGAPTPAFARARRGLVIGGLVGAGTAVLGGTGLAAVGVGLAAGGGGSGPLRPPGAVPEDDFLARCVRCAACIAACPPNALQPAYVAAGLSGVFSPTLVPASGPCDPHCTRCGEVCPTGAIRTLAGDERLWAKTGTAVIEPKTCIAWETGEPCMVCDEVCPFDAVDFRIEPGHPVALPYVEASKCSGCGACENACPVPRPAAIRVAPDDALRLAAGSYVAEGRRRGLTLALDTEKPAKGPIPGRPAEEPAPGFDGPAPGFTP